MLLAWAKDVRDRRASPALRPSSSHLLLCSLAAGLGQVHTLAFAGDGSAIASGSEAGRGAAAQLFITHIRVLVTLSLYLRLKGWLCASAHF